MRILPSQSTRHEAEGGVDVIVLHGELRVRSDRRCAPNRRRPRRPADPRRDASRASRTASRSTHRAEIVHVRGNVIVAVRGGRGQRLAYRRSAARRAARPRESALARSSIHLRGAGIGRAAVGRVVLEAAILRRIVRWRDHDAVGEARGAARDCTSGWRARAPASACSPGRRRPSPRRRSPPAPRARWRTPARRARACPWRGRAGRRRRLRARYSQIACVIARMWSSLNEPSKRRAAMSRRAES